MLHNVICFEHNVYKLSNSRNEFQTRGLGIAQRYCKAESTSSHLAGVATIVDLFCWVSCQEFVLIIYDHIANVMSIFFCTYILNKSETLHLNCLPSVYKIMQTKNAIKSVS